MSKWIVNWSRFNNAIYIEEPCKICNQWIGKGETGLLVYVPDEIRKKYNISNFFVHEKEWMEFAEGLSDDELAQKILSIKKQRIKPYSEEVLFKIDCFEKACNQRGFNKKVVSKNKRYIKMKKRKTSLTIMYDTVYDRIKYEYGANEGLFGGLFIHDLLAKIENDMYKLEGSDKHNDYSSDKIIEKAIKDVNEMMK